VSSLGPALRPQYNSDVVFVLGDSTKGGHMKLRSIAALLFLLATVFCAVGSAGAR
jgi:hypothetical protein